MFARVSLSKPTVNATCEASSIRLDLSSLKTSRSSGLRFPSLKSAGCGSKIGTPTETLEPRSQGLKPAVSWWFRFVLTHTQRAVFRRMGPFPFRTSGPSPAARAWTVRPGALRTGVAGGEGEAISGPPLVAGGNTEGNWRVSRPSWFATGFFGREKRGGLFAQSHISTQAFWQEDTDTPIPPEM